MKLRPNLTRYETNPWLLAGVFAVGLVLGIWSMGCTDEENTIRTLRSHGFRDIHTTGYEPFGCGDKDTFSTGFSAVNSAGERVSGVVCCGLVMKGCTVRF